MVLMTCHSSYNSMLFLLLASDDAEGADGAECADVLFGAYCA